MLSSLDYDGIDDHKYDSRVARQYFWMNKWDLAYNWWLVKCVIEKSGRHERIKMVGALCGYPAVDRPKTSLVQVT